jgi:predicted short-subunit dehydrogenase-like oxidoreductase (DUF2520 family)
MKNVAVVGAGRLGTVLGAALRKKGFTIRAIADRRLAAARESRKIIGAGVATRNAALAADGADIIILAVPDDMIGPAARTLAAAARPAVDWKGKVVLHTSGAITSTALAPLRAAGAACGSFHPVQTFPRKDLPASVFGGAAVDLEGDPRAVRAGAALARKLGARPFVLRAENKALFHAASGMASNLYLPLFDAACGLLGKAGITDRDAVRILLPLAEGTLRSVKGLDRAEALTGPISRGDVETVRLHLSALRPYPAARKIYRLLGAEALRLARRRNKIAPRDVRELTRLLRGVRS